MRKLVFVNELKNMEEYTLAKQVFNEQVESGLPGFAIEAKYLCEDIGLPNILKNNVDKTEWKKLVKERAVTVFDEDM